MSVHNLLMQKYKTAEKMKINQLYHSYNVSTKCFDGALLYEMFLSNHRSPGYAFQPSEKFNKKKSQSEEETVGSIVKNKPILEIGPLKPQHISLELHKHTEPDFQYQPKRQETKEVYRRGCQSGNTFYSKATQSLDSTKGQSVKDRVKIAIQNHRVYESAFRTRRPLSKKKLAVEVNEFVPR